MKYITLEYSDSYSRHAAYNKVRHTECSRKGDGEVIQLRVRGCYQKMI